LLCYDFQNNATNEANVMFAIKPKLFSICIINLPMGDFFP
jgi:hypothetical protein